MTAAHSKCGVLGDAETATFEWGDKLNADAGERLAKVLMTREVWDLPAWRQSIV